MQRLASWRGLYNSRNDTQRDHDEASSETEGKRDWEHMNTFGFFRSGCRAGSNWLDSMEMTEWLLHSVLALGEQRLQNMEGYISHGYV